MVSKHLEIEGAVGAEGDAAQALDRQQGRAPRLALCGVGWRPE